MGVQDFSTTPASNTTINSIDIAENCAAANINNAIRQLMADVRAGLASKGSDVTSAASIDLGAVNGPLVDITGSTGPIASFGTVAAGIWRVIRFISTPTITHHATSLILPTGADITAAAGDSALAFSLGSGNWVVLIYQRKSGVPLSLTGLSGSGLTGIRKQGLETIWVPAVAMYPQTTNGCAAIASVDSGSNDVEYKVLDFDTSTQEFAQFAVRMPKSWNEGTVTFAPYWTAASGSGGVVWALQGVALSDDDALNTAFGTEQTSTDTLITAADVHVGPTSAAITIAGTPAAGDLTFFRVKRNPSDGSDTLGVDARLLGVALFFTTDASDDT